MSVTAVRDESLDTLKAATTLLVIFHHTAITYGGAGDWFYREIPQGRTPSSDLLSLFNTYNQAWFMGLFFLIAGYFTPAAFARRGVAGYLKERALRLGVPLLAFGFGLGPLTVALAATARGKDFLATLFYLWRHGRFIPGPLWFAEALLIFAVGYAWLPKPRACAGFPSNRVLLAAALAVGLVNFAVRLLIPVGATALALQPAYFPAYILLFWAGCAASSWPTLDAATPAQRRLWGRVAGVAFLVFPLTAALWRRVTGTDADFSGGWSLPALIYAVFDPLFAWGVVMALLHGFRRLSALGPVGRAMARGAYGVYVVHPLFVVGVAIALRDVDAPPLAKFLVTGSLAALASWLLIFVCLKLPGVSRVI
jgi:surface polysaccharide O-acyltransferase-like enzyme